MATLTEEQRKRIEDNKQRALAIRAAKQIQASQFTPSVSATPVVSSTPRSGSSPSISSSNPTQSNSHVLPIVTNSYSNTSKLNQNSFKSNFNKAPSWNQKSSVSASGGEHNFHQQRPKTQVTFTLRSRDRFNVDWNQFNQKLIEVIKTIPGKMFG